MPEPFITFLAEKAVYFGAHANTAYWVNALFCFGAGIVMLYLKLRVLRQERWVILFSIGFLLMAFQYLLGWIINNRDWLAASDQEYIKGLLIFLRAAAGPANSLLFLAAAFALLGVRGKPYLSRRLLFCATVAFLCIWQYWPEPFHLIPDAIFSAYVLLYLAYAFFLNFRIAKPWVARVFYILLFLYGLASLVHGLLPCLVGTEYFVPLIDKIELMAGKRTDILLLLPIDALTSLSLAILMPFKFALFLAGFFLTLKCLLYLVPGRRETMQGVNLGITDYISAGGLPRYLSEISGADLATLWVLPPGGGDQALRFWWEKESAGGSEKIEKVPTENESAVGMVLWGAGVEVVSSRDLEKETHLPRLEHLGKKPGSQVTVPIVFNGQAAGVLHAEWWRTQAYTATIIVRMRQLADAAAQPLHQKCQTMALENLYASLDGLNQKSLGDLVLNLVTHLYSVLGPYGVGLYVRRGEEIYSAYFQGRYIDHEKVRSQVAFHEWLADQCKKTNPEVSTKPVTLNFSGDRTNNDPPDISGLLIFSLLEKEPQHRGILVKNKAFLAAVESGVQRTIFWVYARDLREKSYQAELEMVKQERPASFLHDLVNQVAGMGGALDNLEEDIKDQSFDTAGSGIHMVKSVAEQIEKMVRNLVRPPNIEREQPCNIQKAMCIVDDRVYLLMKMKDFELINKIDGKLVVDIPLETAYSILNNLIINAMDAMSRGGTIEITTEIRMVENFDATYLQKKRNYAWLHITNPGAIPDGENSKLFIRGFTTKGEKGSGLGLSFGKNELTRYGGDLILSSATNGKVTFSMIMPLPEGEALTS